MCPSVHKAHTDTCVTTYVQSKKQTSNDPSVTTDYDTMRPDE